MSGRALPPIPAGFTLLPDGVEPDGSPIGPWQGDLAGAVAGVFPGAVITSGLRSPGEQQALIARGATTATRSPHLSGDGFDMRPIEGVTPEQAAQQLRDAGVPITQIIDETRAGTGPHWHLRGEFGGSVPAIDQRGGGRPTLSVRQPSGDGLPPIPAGMTLLPDGVQLDEGSAPEAHPSFTDADMAQGYRTNADGSTDTPGPDGLAYVRTGPQGGGGQAAAGPAGEGDGIWDRALGMMGGAARDAASILVPAMAPGTAPKAWTDDLGAGFTSGLLKPVETLAYGAGGVARMIGATDAADRTQGLADGTDHAVSRLANDPNSVGFRTGEFGGEMAATWPVAELRLAGKVVPHFARAEAASAAALAAGEKAGLGTRAIAATGRGIDLAAQGTVAGVAVSGGHDWLQNGVIGGIAGPAVGLAAEKAIPAALRAYAASKGIATKAGDTATAQALERFMARRGAQTALDAPTASRAAPEALPGWSADEIAQGWRRGADGQTEFVPAKSIRRGAELPAGGFGADGTLHVNIEGGVREKPLDLMTPSKFTDRHLAGDGLDDPRMVRYAAENTDAIGAEMDRRAAAPSPTRPGTEKLVRALDGLEARYSAEASQAVRDGAVVAQPIAPARSAMSLNDARAAAELFRGQPITNGITGVQATVSNATLAKMTHTKAVGKSSSVQDHALAVANADELFRTAELSSRYPDTRGNKEVQISRWRSYMQMPDGMRGVKLTVKETAHPGNPNPLYTIETMKVEPVAPTSPWRGVEGVTEQSPPTLATGSELSIPAPASGSNPDPDNMRRLAEALTGGELGSRGARAGLEANTNFPREVAEHVQRLTAEGVPLDQALREAEISYVGARPTMADVTRNPLDQRAINEGAKLDTPEGLAMAGQKAANNAALHNAMQRDVAALGGVPDPGEVMHTTARSLATASDRERAEVRRLYDLAALEHGHTAPEGLEPNLADTSMAAPHYSDQRPRVDVPDEYDELARSRVPGPSGRPVHRRGPMDMVTWLRSRGGIQEQAGELRHAGIDNRARDLEFARNEGFLGGLIRPGGMTLDDAAQAAHEAGFFPNHYDRPSVREFLETLGDTHRGTNRAYRPEDLDEIDRFERTREARYDAEQRADGMARDGDTSPVGMSDLDGQRAPDAAYADDLGRMGGSVSAKPLHALLHDDVAFRAPVTPEGRAFVSGMRRALAALSDGGKRGLPPADLERLRKIANGAYDPMGGEVNQLVGQTKGIIDRLFDELGDASPAYKAARAKHRGWAEAFEQPEGVSGLIRRDAQGRFVQDDNWRKAEQLLIGSGDDRPFIQIVRRLEASGDHKTLARIKAAVMQRVYQAATGAQAGKAVDQLSNSPFSGAAMFAELTRIGQPKLRALFSPEELGRLATIGRAAAHINEAVPGTHNPSGSASTMLNALARMNGTHAKPIVGKVLDAGLTIGGQVAGQHVVPGVGGVVVGMAGNVLKAGFEQGAKAKAAREVAQQLKHLSTPADARAANSIAEKRLAELLARRSSGRAAAPRAVQVAALASALRDQKQQDRARRAALVAGLERVGRR